MYKYILNGKQIRFKLDNFPTFCGGKVLTEVTPFSPSFTREIDNWESMSAAEKDKVFSDIKREVYATLHALTEHLRTKRGEGEFFKFDRFRDDDVPWEETTYPLSVAFLVAADAINGERNDPYGFSTYDLCMSNPAWTAPFHAQLNPNSYREANVWVLKCPPLITDEMRQDVAMMETKRRGYEKRAKEQFLAKGHGLITHTINPKKERKSKTKDLELDCITLL